MTPRQRRIVLVVGILAGVSLAGVLALRAFQDNVMFFFDPTQVAAGEAPKGERFRLGGMVRPGTVDRTSGSLDMAFVVTDFKHDVKVRYSGVVPDLFRENQAVIATGRMRGDVFVAENVLAKHDETYMPKEVADKMAAAHKKHAVPPSPAAADAAAPSPTRGEGNN